MSDMPPIDPRFIGWGYDIGTVPAWLADLDDDDVADLVRMLWILQERNGGPLQFTEREIVEAPLIDQIERIDSVRSEPGDYGITLRIKMRDEDA